MLTKIATWWIERQGHYIVRRGSVQMVLSGHFEAHQSEDGSYKVVPPFAGAFVVARNHTYMQLNAKSRGIPEGNDTVVWQDGGCSVYSPNGSYTVGAA